MAEIPEGFELVEDIPEGFEPVESSFPGAGVIEPALTVASSIPSTIASGFAGLVGGAVGGLDTAADYQKAIQSAGTFEPRTPEGKAGLEKLSEAAKLLNLPAAGLAGLAELISGAGIDEAASKVESVKGDGLGSEVGGDVLEATGSPAAATLADLLSQGASDILAGGALAKTAKLAGQGTKTVGAQALKTTTPATQAAIRLADDISRFKTPAARQIAQQLKTGEINTDIAKFRLADEGITAPTPRQKLLGADLPKVAKDTPTIKAARQGFDEGFLEAVKKAGTRADKAALLKMTSIAKKGRTNSLYADEFRPSFVAGDVLLEKVNAIKAINRAAGKEIGGATKYLKGQKVPVASIGDDFLDSLSSLKIAVKPDGKLDFKDALISGAGRKKAIVDIFDRMKRNKDPDALALHELKQYTDEVISYGKDVRGLGGKAENALRDLRASLKTALDDNFPKYAEANKAYSDTIKLLDEVQTLAGKKTNLASDSAGGDLAVLARRITSNAQSRGRVKEALTQLDNVLDTHGSFGGVKRLAGDGGDKVNFRLLMNYADELDKVTGNAAKTSFTGGIETALKATRGPKEFLADKATEAARKAAGINVKGAHDSMTEFLKAELKRNQK